MSLKTSIPAQTWKHGNSASVNSESRSLAIHSMEVAAGLDKVPRGPSQGKMRRESGSLELVMLTGVCHSTVFSSMLKNNLIISTPLRNPDVYKPAGKVNLL